MVMSNKKGKETEPQEKEASDNSPLKIVLSRSHKSRKYPYSFLYYIHKFDKTSHFKNFATFRISRLNSEEEELRK